MNNELKQCPFCDGEVEISSSEEYEWTFTCFECDAHVNFGLIVMEDAIEAWNKRVTKA